MWDLKKELLNIDQLLNHEKCNDILKQLYKLYSTNENYIYEIIEKNWSFRFAYAYPEISVYNTIPKIIEIHFNNIDEIEKALYPILNFNQK